MMTENICWCGNSDLDDFSPDYKLCEVCATLVRSKRSEAGVTAEAGNAVGFYGQDYWFKHQTSELGDPDLLSRSRDDLTERTLYWLRYVLKYSLPPARSLELGSAHGGFVALLGQVGFKAAGLELSPWVVQFAEENFNIPMYSGPVEDQVIEPESLDLILMMDVLEHLPDPLSTLNHCLHLLKSDGKLFIQTPEYRLDYIYKELVQENQIFLKLLKPIEHLYLFSRDSLSAIFSSLGLDHHTFLPPCFPYDMFVVASREPFDEFSTEEIEKTLVSAPEKRMVLALLDLQGKYEDLENKLIESDIDREKRLNNILTLESLIKESEADRKSRLDLIHQLEAQLQESELDRSARLKVIKKQEKQISMLSEDKSKLEELLNESRADRSARLEVIQSLEKQLEKTNEDRLKLETLLRESDADRAARLETINELERQLNISEADREERLKSIKKLDDQLKKSEADREARLEVIKELEDQLELSERDRADRLELINQLDTKLREVEVDHQERLKVIKELDKKLQDLVEDRSSQVKLMEEQHNRLDDLEREKRYFIENLERKSKTIKGQLEQIESLEDELGWGPIRVLRSFQKRMHNKDS